MNIFVIGGGASGLLAAINAKTNNNKVTIIEKNKTCGKKILITGNGKCNYLNEDLNINHYNSENIEKLNDIINEENKNTIISFFENIGISPRIKDGYYYPMSNQATSIQTSLIKEAIIRKIDILEEEVIDINYEDKFIIKTNLNKYQADKVIIATGSKAHPKTGSDGKGYELLKKFNHSIIKPLPALVQLKAEGLYLKKWAGIRTEVNIKLYEDEKLIKTESGEIQLTDYGVSGICVFQLSSKVARGLDKNHKETIYINFLPTIKEEIKMFLDNRNQKLKSRTISELLDGLLNYKLVNLLLELSKIDKDNYYSNLTNKQKENLYNNLTNFKLEIKGTNDFEFAQVCSGGVPLNEINTKTMESLKQKDLYIVGELLDVDGECGGFNLGFAFITGYLAGINCNK